MALHKWWTIFSSALSRSAEVKKNRIAPLVSRFTVEVEKRVYEDSEPEIVEQITGHIVIQANDGQAAIKLVNEMMRYDEKKGCLQTNDSRIVWDNNPRCVCDPVYEDFSFGTTGEVWRTRKDE